MVLKFRPKIDRKESEIGKQLLEVMRCSGIREEVKIFELCLQVLKSDCYSQSR